MKNDDLVSDKSRLAALLLCYFLGLLGAHRFYLGRFVSGFFMLITFGGLIIGAVVDFIFILCGQMNDSEGIKVSDWQTETPFRTVGSTLILMFLLSIGSLFAAQGLDPAILPDFIKNGFSAPAITRTVEKSYKTYISEDKSTDLIKYTDENGVPHFVNDISKVPPEHRHTVKKDLDLPVLNRATDFGPS